MDGMHLVSDTDDPHEFGLQLKNAVYKLYPGCCIYDAEGSRTYIYSSDGLSCRIYGLRVLEEEQKVIDKWAVKKANELFSEGMDRREVIRTAYYYLADTFSYDSNLKTIEGGIQSAQSAFGIIMTNKGICASMSRAFASLLKTAVFDSEGFLDWKNGKEHIDVYLLTNGRHMLNAVILNDVKYYYDLTKGTAGLRGYNTLVKDKESYEWIGL